MHVLDDERRWFRCHPLFQAGLRRRLQQERPDEVPDLHRRASQGYAQAGLIPAAIEHALAAGDGERAAHWVESVAEATLMRGEIVTFRRWIAALPADQVCARPGLCVLDALALALERQPPEAIQARLQDAEAGIGSGGRDAGGDLRGAVAALRAALARGQGDARRTREEARRALALLPESSLFLRGYTANHLSVAHFLLGDVEAALLAMDEAVQIHLKLGNVLIAVEALCALAGMLTARGQLHRAEQLLQQAMTLATDRRGRLLPIAGKALLALGELYREWYDLDAAVECFSRGIELAGRYGEITAFVGYISLAHIRQAQGDLAETVRLIEIARQFSQDWESSQLDDLLVEGVQVRLWLTQGDVEAAVEWIAARGLAGFLKGEPLMQPETGAELREVEILTLARVLLAAGRPAPALAVLDDLLHTAAALKQQRRIVEVEVWRALALQALGADAAALAALERALRLGEPEGYVWTFLDGGLALARLLTLAAAGEVAPAYARRLLAGFPAGADWPAPDAMGEPFGAREIEVLRLAADGLSNEEIAQVLGLAPSTIDWYTANLFARLGARNRLQAVARARALGILAPD